MLLAVHVDGATIATAVVSAGLQGSRRRQVGTSDDGRTTVTARGSSTKRLNLTIEMRDVPPPQALRARALVGLTIDTGTLLARGERLFRALPGGRELRQVTPARAGSAARRGDAATGGLRSRRAPDGLDRDLHVVLDSHRVAPSEVGPMSKSSRRSVHRPGFAAQRDLRR